MVESSGAMQESIPSRRSVSLELFSLLARERIVLLLLFATFGTLAWQHWGMERTVVVNDHHFFRG